MKRREFLVQSALATLGLSACARSAPVRLPGGAAGTSSPTRVVVIGAGLAGLSAAHELRRVGLDVTVLEARARRGHVLAEAVDRRQPVAHGEVAEPRPVGREPDLVQLEKGLTLDFEFTLT